MRLRNRITKADFWTDPELLRWNRDKRFAYKSLWAIAEDSACIEDDPFGWKCSAWASPLDADITVELLTSWRDEWIAAGKLVPYESGGKRYLYIPTMAEHEKPRNPQSPSIPLPAWVVWQSNERDKRKGIYLHECCTDVVQPANDELTSVPALPCPVLPCPDLSRPAVAPLGAVQDVAEQFLGSLLSSKQTRKLAVLIEKFGEQEAADRLKTATRQRKEGVGFDLWVHTAENLAAKDVRRSRPEPTFACKYCHDTRVIVGAEGEEPCPYCEEKP